MGVQMIVQEPWVSYTHYVLWHVFRSVLTTPAQIVQIEKLD